MPSSLSPFAIVMFTASLLVAAGCGDDDGCTGADCPIGQVCTSGSCQNAGAPDSGTDAGTDARTRDASTPDAHECPAVQSCRSGLLCCDAGDECVDDLFCFARCENTRCGDNGSICCGDGEICLDGVVCAAECGPRESLCGADNELCCDAREVCLDDACVAPGERCEDDFDCLNEGDYCETVVGQCLPIPERDSACEILPEFDAIELDEEWHWAGETIGGTLYQHVVTTPVVGDVSGDGVPDVIAIAYATGRDTIMVALDGGTGRPHWVIGPDSEQDPEWGGVPVVANFDPSDDALEVLYWLESGGIRLVDGDGVTELGLRTDAGGGIGRSAPSVADLNADGIPDVVVGCHAMNGRDIGNAAMDFFDRGGCMLATQRLLHSVIADLNGDGTPDVTTGAFTMTGRGEILWGSADGEHGFAAVADLDGSGTPEVITTRSGEVRVVDGATGTVLVGAGGTWFDILAIPGGGHGGAPTIADFDGDGLPEISAAGRGNYTVYDPDCLTAPPRSGGVCAPGTTNFISWQAPTQDISSSATGSSVFDFQGDGVAEVIYNDECFLHVYDGRDGREVLSEPRPNSSRTGLEYPLVVDVDRDGNSEIVVPANRDRAVTRDGCPAAYAEAFGVDIVDLPPEYATGTAGIYVFGDPGDRWVRTRPIWSQFAYHVTDVSDRGEVPLRETDNWSAPGLNNYRQNVQGAGVFNAANLSAELEATAACASQEVRLSAVVTNFGSRGLPAGIPVQIVQTAPMSAVVLDAVTSGPLLPGQSERITGTAMGVPYDVDLRFEVRVDGADIAMECVEDDNTAVAGERCERILL